MPVPAALRKLMLTEGCKFDHSGRTLSHILLLWASKVHPPICIRASVTLCGHLFVCMSVFSSVRMCIPLGQRPNLRHGLRFIFTAQLKQSVFVH